MLSAGTCCLEAAGSVCCAGQDSSFCLFASHGQHTAPHATFYELAAVWHCCLSVCESSRPFPKFHRGQLALPRGGLCLTLSSDQLAAYFASCGIPLCHCLPKRPLWRLALCFRGEALSRQAPRERTFQVPIEESRAVGRGSPLGACLLCSWAGLLHSLGSRPEQLLGSGLDFRLAVLLPGAATEAADAQAEEALGAAANSFPVTGGGARPASSGEGYSDAVSGRSSA